MQNLKVKQSLLYLIAICLLCFFIAHSVYYFHFIGTVPDKYAQIKLLIYAITDVIIACFIFFFIIYSICKTMKNKSFNISPLFIYTCLISLFLILVQSFANNLNTTLNQVNNANFVVQLLYTIFLGLFISSIIVSFICYITKKDKLTKATKKIIYTILYCLFILNCVLFTILTFNNIPIYQNSILDIINQPQIPEEFINTLLNSMQLNTIIYKLQISIALINAILSTITYMVYLFKFNNAKIKQTIITLCLTLISSLVLIYYLIFAILDIIFDYGFIAVFSTQLITLIVALLLISIYIFLIFKPHRTLPVKAE